MFDFIGVVLIPAFIVLVFRYLNAEFKAPVFGVYNLNKNKNYLFKLTFMFIYLKLRQLYYHIKHIWGDEIGQNPDGVHVHNDDLTLEEKYFLGDNPKAVDAVYFNGVSQKGEALTCSLARRAGHVVDSFLYLKVEGEDLLLSPCLPDTYQVQTVTEAGKYTIQGLNIINFMPMRAWKIVYNGDMKSRKNPEKTVKVEMELTWSARWSPFNYGLQMSALSLAKDLAREQWSAKYFKLLKKFHQTHYEQMGYITGTVSIDGIKHTMNMQCVRDHRFGPFQDWRTYHRFVYHYIFLENGDCMTIGTICQPAILSHLTTGYVCSNSDHIVLPIQSCDFKLYQHGEGQVLPKDYGFTYKVAGKSYTIRFEVTDEDIHYIGKVRVSKVYERWCTVEVEGIKGWASSEWQYNNQVKKPISNE